MASRTYGWYFGARGGLGELSAAASARRRRVAVGGGDPMRHGGDGELGRFQER